jgi:lipoate-protein ligase A
MYFLQLTLPEPAANIALDDALLEEAETSSDGEEVLRVWEPPAPLVVLGRSSRAENEVELDTCRGLRIPILRRPSGGAAIVGGPGCLMYAVVLCRRRLGTDATVDGIHRHVLGRHAAALGQLLPGVQHRGISDLAWHGKKFSGNSLRCRRRYVLYHGTILYAFPLPLVESCLREPSRAPEYRAGRPHAEFLTNIPLECETICEALRACWNAHEPKNTWPREITAQLLNLRYGRPKWNEMGHS